MAGLHIKKGDLVQVITGKDKGVQGKVIAVLPESDKVLVEGVNRIKKHTKVGQTTRGAKTGGIVTQEAPIHVSNVMLVDPSDNRPTRVGYRRETVTKNRPDGTSYETSRSVRVSKRTGKDI
ncbi:MAG: 50S ribosomal protein L24 [Actinobacteria bacterium]|jgi:large subunit ribosomal protein L24|nr:50S ribosomal protein L24 [Actinomycetota bacterium]